MELNRNKHIQEVKRIVVKLGSNILTHDGGLNTGLIDAICDQACVLISKGIEIIIVSSGAMSAGMRKIGLNQRPAEIPKRQAISAVGQANLILAYEQAFGRHAKKVAQILLTSDDLDNRTRYLNSRNTLNTLLEWGIVPIINENDTIMVEEIKVGDNDNLSAMITLLMDADFLVNLTDIDGLYDKDPRRYSDAKLIPLVASIDAKIEEAACQIPGALGTGGMYSKIRAAKKVTTAGVPITICRGDTKDVLLRVMNGDNVGTFFIPQGKRMQRKKCWIAFTLKSKGLLSVDEGASEALTKRGKSLLPSGITAVEGSFPVGSAVDFQSPQGNILGTGLVNYSADDIRKIMGLKSHMIADRLGQKLYDEVIHRDNLVITVNH